MLTLPAHIALVPEDSDILGSAELARVSAAIQRQVARDFGPRWEVNATVDAFPRIEEIPIGYWPVILSARALGDDEGFHKTAHGEPFAVIEAGSGWSVTASHEILEMLVDPSGDRTVPGTEPGGSARVEFLVEVCDACQSAACAYTINDVLVSDFVLPDYFAPEAGTAASYSFAHHVDVPHGLANGGSLSWLDRVRGKAVHLRMDGQVTREEFPLDESDPRSLRARIHVLAKNRRSHVRVSGIEFALKVARKQDASSAAMRLRAETLRRELAKVGEPGRRRLANPEDALVSRRLAGALASARELVPELVAFLERAQFQLTRGEPNLSDQWELSAVKSSLRAPVRPVVLTAREVPGLGRYDDEDVGWAKVLWEYFTRDKTPFVACPATAWETLVRPLSDSAVIAVAGDWGTHNQSSANIGKTMAALLPTHTIHLGDVYYAGTPEEEAQFIHDWPLGSAGTFILNSNHEMYSGGAPYFRQALQSDRLGPQVYSYFALSSSRWLFIGLDTAYNATRHEVTPYDVGHLTAADPQVLWIQWLLGSAHATSPDGKPKRIGLFTHHEALVTTGRRTTPTALMNEVLAAMGRAPDLWYWGHVHAAAVYAACDVGGRQFHGRLVGHGGIPYVSEFFDEDDAANGMVWAERDPSNRKAVGRNGFAVLRLRSDGGVAEEFSDETGASRFKCEV